MERLLVPGLNHLLKHQEWALARLRTQAGARIRIEAGALRFGLGIDEHGRFAAAPAPDPVDVVLTLPPDVPLKLLLGRENLFSAMRLSGSVDTAEALAFVFRNLAWDIEADLATLVGDIAAHRLTRFGRALGTSLTAALKRSSENIVEYFAENEGSPLVSRNAMSSFTSELAELSADLLRLEKRVATLQR